MKKILAATVATAAIALAAPAFAQVVDDVTGTVQGQAQVRGQVDPQDVTDPLAQTQEDTQDAVRGQVDDAQEALPQPEASVTAEGAAQVPGVSGEGQASAQVTTPDTSDTIDSAQNAADEAIDEAQDAAPTMSAEAEAEAEAEASAMASNEGVSADVQTAANAAASTDLPDQVQEAVSDGRYTTDDLNRAQLAALQAPGSQGSR